MLVFVDELAVVIVQKRVGSDLPKDDEREDGERSEDGNVRDGL